MKVNYNDIVLSPHQKAVYVRTIEQNPFIPTNNLLKTKLYDRQIYAICSEDKRKLLGGSAYSGKSRYGATSALQWFEVPNYRCLIIRRTFDDVIATGGIVDYVDKWTSNFDFITHNQSKRVFHNELNDAKIYYNYMLYEEDRKKFKSRGYNKIIVDEASELLMNNLKYLNRSLRKTEADIKIPLSLEYISNPDASSGIEFLKKQFVSKNATWPYFEMNFWNNPFVDHEEYQESLNGLSKPDYEFQMGNWDYVLKSGDIFSNDMIIAATINQEIYKWIRERYGLKRVIRTWDIASTEKKTSDYSATSLFHIFSNGIKIVTKQESFKLRPGKLQEQMKLIMAMDGLEVEQRIEHQPAAAGDHLDYYFEDDFRGYNCTFIPVSKNKVLRAGKLVPELKNGAYFIENNELNDNKNGTLLFLEDSAQPWLNIFTKQAVGFPNFDVKISDEEESLHDDRIDTVSLILIKPPRYPDRMDPFRLF